VFQSLKQKSSAVVYIKNKNNRAMKYYTNKTVEGNFDEVIEKVTEALKEEGFGVLSDIDVKETLRNKLDVDFRKYRILGACNPPNAHKALTTEPNIGLMLPCNVVVQETENGKVDVSAIDPNASMAAVENPELEEVASFIKNKLEKVVNSL
jgi:uncharacterized protein (DUF302 family)